MRGFHVQNPSRGMREHAAVVTRDTARNRDAIALKASAIVQLTCTTAQRNGAIQHSKAGGWCQGENDDDYPGTRMFC